MCDKNRLFNFHIKVLITYYTIKVKSLQITQNFNPFAPGDFAEKRVLKLVEWFSGHCRAIKS